MKVTAKDVSYVADLANLELNDEERQRMVRDLNSILDYIDLLNELDTSSVQPMSQVSDRYGADQSVKRSDRFAHARRGDSREGVRKALPRHVALQDAREAAGTWGRARH